VVQPFRGMAALLSRGAAPVKAFVRDLYKTRGLAVSAGSGCWDQLKGFTAVNQAQQCRKWIRATLAVTNFLL